MTKRSLRTSQTDVRLNDSDQQAAQVRSNVCIFCTMVVLNRPGPSWLPVPPLARPPRLPCSVLLLLRTQLFLLPDQYDSSVQPDLVLTLRPPRDWQEHRSFVCRGVDAAGYWPQDVAPPTFDDIPQWDGSAPRWDTPAPARL